MLDTAAALVGHREVAPHLPPQQQLLPPAGSATCLQSLASLLLLPEAPLRIRRRIMHCSTANTLVHLSGVSRAHRSAIQHPSAWFAADEQIPLIRAEEAESFLQLLDAPVKHMTTLRCAVDPHPATGGVALTLYVPGGDPARELTYLAMRAAIRLLHEQTTSKKVTHLRVHQGWNALVNEQLAPAFFSLLEHLRPHLESLTFTGDEPRSRFLQPAMLSNVERQRHGDLYYLLSSLTHLCELKLPHLLPPIDVDLSLLAMTLTRLQKLQIGRGIAKQPEGIRAVQSLLHLTTLEWSGWTNSQIRLFLAKGCAPPSLTELILREEDQLNFLSANSIGAVDGMNVLQLHRTSILQDRFSLQALTGLGMSTIHTLDLAFERRGQMEHMHELIRLRRSRS